MGKVTVDEEHLNDIGEAILARGGARAPVKPGEMAGAILNIPSPGPDVVRYGDAIPAFRGKASGSYEEYEIVLRDGGVYIRNNEPGQDDAWYDAHWDNITGDELAAKLAIRLAGFKVNGGITDAFARDLLEKPIAAQKVGGIVDAMAVTIVKLTDGDETMAKIKGRLDSINSSGKHVFFDTAEIEVTNPLYLCTIFIDTEDGILRLQDQVTGKQYIGSYDETETIEQVLSKAVDAYVGITVTAQTQDGVTVTGQTVSLYEGSDESGVLKGQQAYEGAPINFMAAKGMEFFIKISSTIPGHFTPSTAHGIANQTTSVTLTYQDVAHISDYAGLAAAVGSITDIDEAKNALVGKVIEDVWVDYDATASGDAASHGMGANQDAQGHPRYYDPMVCIDIRDVQDGAGVTHRGAVMLRKWATKYTIVFDPANREEATAEEDATMREGVYYYGYAPDYANNRTYAVNEVVRVVTEGVTKIYKCATAVTAAEEFDPAKWTEIVDETYPAAVSFVRINPNGEYGTATPFADYVRIFRNSVNDSSRNIFLYGYNRYEHSYWRKYLTAEQTVAPGAWVVPSRIGQMKPSDYNVRSPYQRGCSAELLAVARAVKVHCASNTVSDGGVEYDVVDKFFLPSRLEYFGTQENGYTTEGETPLKYWRDKVVAGHDQTIDPTTVNPSDNTELVNDVRKNTYVSSKTSGAQFLRLRSALRGNSCNVWYVGAGGYLNNSNAGNAYVGVPACVIY